MYLNRRENGRLKMKNLESDAFVFFGATGDLASKQIFPALQAMIAHGHFDMPIIGVLRSTAAWTPARSRNFRQNSNTSKETTVRKRHSASCEKLSAKHLGLFITLLYLRTRLRPSPNVWPMQSVTRERGWSSRSHLAATLPRRRRSIERFVNLSRNRRFSGSTITSARNWFKICCTSPSPILSSSRFGTATMSRVSSLRWLKTLTSRGGESSVKCWVRSVMSYKTTCWRSSHCSRWRHRSAKTRMLCAMEKQRAFRAQRPLSPSDVVRGQFRSYRNEKGVALDSQVETFVRDQVDQVTH